MYCNVMECNVWMYHPATIHLRRPVLLLKVAQHLHGVGDPKNEPRPRGIEAAEVGRQRNEALLQPGQVEVALQDHLLLDGTLWIFLW